MFVFIDVYWDNYAENEDRELELVALGIMQTDACLSYPGLNAKRLVAAKKTPCRCSLQGSRKPCEVY